MNISQFALLFLVVSMTTVCAESFSGESDKTYRVKSESVSFKNGDVTLKGTLYLPESPGKYPAIVAFHAASGGMRNFPFYEHLTKEIPAQGFAVLLFDRRGSGESSGDFETADFDALASDGIAGVEFLKFRKEIDANKIGVWGVSQGGWIAPLAAKMSEDISFVVIVSGPGVSPAEQMSFAAEYSIREAGFSEKDIEEAVKLRALVDSFYRGDVSKAEAEKAIGDAQEKKWFNLAYLPGRGNLPTNPKTTKWFQEMDFDPLPTLSNINVPMLVFFGETDRWVPIEESIKRIKQSTKTNKKVKFHRIKGADHLMMTGVPDSGGPVSKQYIETMLNWLKKQNK